MEVIESRTLRRIALARQGYGSKQAFGSGLKATLATIQHLGSVQIDTISVVARAHNHILLARVPSFSPTHIDQLLAQRKVFEYRFPVAAFRAIEDYRYTLLHTEKFRAKPRTDDKALMRRVLKRIKEEGALRSRDFDSSKKKGKGWWDWKPAKLALEQLYFQGDLMISRRDGFEKLYDLTERVLPSDIRNDKPSLTEFATYLVESTLKAYGFGTYATFAAGALHLPIASVLKPLLKEYVSEGRLHQYRSENGDAFWADANTIQGPLPRVRKAVSILSPFDNLVIHRDFLREVFEFDFLIECYFPESKRTYGYYCLPIIQGDQFVGRMDCKAHREERRFEIKALYLEPNFASPSSVRELARPLAVATREYAKFDGCDEIVVTKTQPNSAKTQLRKAFSEHR